MSMLQCEVCGGKLIGKPEGIFECEYCGIQYDTSWAKAKIQEIKGTVQVEGTVEVTGTVKVEGSANIESLLKRGRMAIQDKEWAKAKECFDQALDIDAECAEAYLCLAMIDEKVVTARDFIFKTLTEDSFKMRLQNKNYQRAKQFADNNLLATLEELEEDILYELYQEKTRKQRESEEAMLRLAPIRKKISNAKNLISVDSINIIGIKSDGTVVATGSNFKVLKWNNIVVMAAGFSHTVGLKSDGTVVAVGKNSDNECDVSKWNNIVAIAAGHDHTVGLKSDGTVVAVGSNQYNQCDVSKWNNIVAIAAAHSHTVGLKSDGTVVAVGDNDYNQCKISKWNNIVAIAAASNHTVGLKSDGTVVAVGDNDYNQCKISKWNNIVAIAAASNHTVGLKSDGTVVAVGKNEYNSCDVSKWNNIVAIAAGYYHTVGLKSDGTVVAVGKNDHNQCDVSKWKLFDNYDNLEEERRTKMAVTAKKMAEAAIQQQKANLRSQGLCQYCGGAFKGLFTKKCTNCGKEKDY